MNRSSDEVRYRLGAIGQELSVRVADQTAPKRPCASARAVQRGDHTGMAQFVVNEPFDGQPATVGNGSQVRFLTDSRATVDALWAMRFKPARRMKVHRG